MTASLSRRTLEADLLRYREAGDFAAQAETLMALGHTATQEDTEIDKDVVTDKAYSLAHGLYGQAWAAYETAGHKRGQAAAILAIAMVMPHIYFRNERLGEVSRANTVHFYDEVLARYAELGDEHEQARVYHIMSGARIYPADVVIQHLQKALDLYERLNDVPAQIGVLETIMNEHPYSSNEYWAAMKHSLQLHQLIDDKWGQLDLLARLNGGRFSPPEHEFYLNRALELHQQLGNKAEEAAFYLEIGKFYSRAKNYEEAYRTLTAAQVLFTELDDVSGLRFTFNCLGWAIAEAQGYEAFLRYYISNTSRTRQIQLNASDLLYRVARANHDFATARSAIQQTIAGLLAYPENQADWYWDWGEMEVYEAGNIHMGFMLCQRAVTLFEQCFPGKNYYHRKLRQVRHVLHLSQHQRRNKP